MKLCTRLLIICDSNLIFRPITKSVAESFGAYHLNPKGTWQTGETLYSDFRAISYAQMMMLHS